MAASSLPLLRLPVTARDMAGEIETAALISLCIDAVSAWCSRQGWSRRTLQHGSVLPKIGRVMFEPTGVRPAAGSMIEIHSIQATESDIEFELRQAHLPEPFATARVEWDTSAGAFPPPAVAVECPPGLPPAQVIRLMGPSDCDQAGHVNVQVFADLADSALRALGQSAEAVDFTHPLRAQRLRISFRSELFSGDLVRVCSAVTSVDSNELRTTHIVVNEFTGEIACVIEAESALGSLGQRSPREAQSLRAQLSVVSRTREGLPAIKPPQGDRAALSPSEQSIETCRETVDTWDADASSLMSARTLVRWCSTGARQFLAAIGLDGARFTRDHCTVAAVDYLIDWPIQVPVGTNVLIRSALLDSSAKSMRFVHHLMDADRLEVMARIEIVGVMFDLKARRSMEIPADVRSRLDSVRA